MCHQQRHLIKSGWTTSATDLCSCGAPRGQKGPSRRWKPRGKGGQIRANAAASSPSSSSSPSPSGADGQLWASTGCCGPNVLRFLTPGVRQRDRGGCHHFPETGLWTADGRWRCVCLSVCECVWVLAGCSLEWPDYFSELIALRTSAAHWTGPLGAADAPL